VFTQLSQQELKTFDGALVASLCVASMLLCTARELTHCHGLAPRMALLPLSRYRDMLHFALAQPYGMHAYLHASGDGALQSMKALRLSSQTLAMTAKTMSGCLLPF
jgi:hypothetical protein